MSYLSTAIKKARYLLDRDDGQILVLEKNSGGFLNVVLDTPASRDAAITTAVNNLLAGVPGALDTLNELATALGDDANFATTVTTALGTRLKWRGPWAATTAYAINDLVLYNGGLYLAPTAFTSGASFIKANWTELLPQIGTYASLAATNAFAGANTFRGRLIVRADDTASPSSSATINLKPAGDGTAAVIAGYHSDSVGYIIHFTDSATMTGDGLIALGLAYGNAGLVLGLHGAGKGISMQTDAGVSANGIYGAHLGTGDLVKLLQGQSGTPGTLVTLQGWSGAPAASRILSIQNTSGQEYAYFKANDGTFHLPNPTTLSEVTFTNGSGGVIKLYVDTGSSSVWSNWLQSLSNTLLIRQGSGASAKGSESMNTLMTFSNGNAISFFGAAAVTKRATTADATDLASVITLANALKADLVAYGLKS